MAFLKFRKGKKRVFVLSIDGVPYTFLKAQMEAGRFPRLRELDGGSPLSRMRSVYPTISSVAWSSYMTGQNPARHGIFGFVDRTPGSAEVFIPTSLNMTSKTLWEILSQHGKQVVVMNVPVTYPPRQVNGLLVSGFLATDLKKATYPAEAAAELETMGYRIDADAALARESLDRFLEDLHLTLDRRVKAMFHLMEKRPWDYFHVHIMGTDRINHFLWGHMESGDARYAPRFLEYYDRIDEILGRLLDRLDDEVTFILMSDHGFCTVKGEVNLSRYLIEQGLLTYRSSPPKGLADIDPGSRAYTLLPGRIYINLRGREPNGGVEPGEYERVREEVAENLLQFRLPESGEPVIREVFKREDIYSGEHLEAAADLFAIPHDGYDLKADARKDTLVEHSALVGMHTYDDASVLIRGSGAIRPDVEIIDLLPTVFSLMDVPLPAEVDGRIAIR
jgi:predicted AlkP superfamily phosphohydrolase/phosphomutase